MALPIHDELAQLSKTNPAGYISTGVFRPLTLKSLLTTIDLLKGKEMRAGQGRLSASLRDVVWDQRAVPTVALALPTSPLTPGMEVDVVIAPGFDVFVEIFITGDASHPISEVILSFAQVRTHMRAENNVLVIEGADFNVTRKINRLAGADARLTSAKIDLLEAARVEGHIGYGVIPEAITASIAQRHEVPLAAVFPVVNFGTNIKLAILAGGQALGIIPTEHVNLESSAHCLCKEGPDFEVTKTQITKTTPANPSVNSTIARLTVGGPLPDNKDPLKDFGPRSPNRSGIVGLYIPTEFADQLTVEVMPAIKVVASDPDAMIGYRAEATVGFKNFRATFDQVGGGILLDIDLDISGLGYCYFHPFKGVRIPIGGAQFSPAPGSNQATIELGFYPAVRSGGIQLKGTLRKAEMGSFLAIVSGLGPALYVLGISGLLAFLIDLVLVLVVSNRLPIDLKREVSKVLADKEWTLIDGLPVADTTMNWFPSAPFDVTPSSLLASFDLGG